MKAISDFIKSLGFTFSFRRLKRAILLIILFTAIGTGVYLFYKFEKSESGSKLIYTKEIENKIDLEDNSIIKIYKKDINHDNAEDYIFIMGKEERSNENALNSIVEMYEDVDFVVIDGQSDNIIKHETKKEFKSDVTLKICEDVDEMYFLITDSSGNIELYDLNYEDVVDIIGNTTESEFNGYTLYTKKDDESNTLQVSIDNYSKNYLKEYNETKNLDYNELQIDISKYRETYLRDKFSEMNLIDVDGDSVLELVGYQYLLYNLDETDNINRTLGNVKTIFEIENSKLIFSNVEINMED